MVDENMAEILVKFEGLNVGGSIKTRTAFNMILDAEKKGLLNENTIIVEGIRSPHEVDMFKENFDNFIILSIFANPTFFIFKSAFNIPDAYCMLASCKTNLYPK